MNKNKYGKLDLTGQRYGRLTVIEEEKRNTGEKTKWICHCDCGKNTNVSTDNLRAGRVVSCGCSKKEKATKHGQWGTRIYRIWADMKQRCSNTKHKYYHRYGGRGITVCDEWTEDFQAFYDWAMDNGYQGNLTIDRKDNDKGYHPDNCRWTTHKKNCNNRSDSVFITVDGESHSISEWAEITGIPKTTIEWRRKAGRTPEEMLKAESQVMI